MEFLKVLLDLEIDFNQPLDDQGNRLLHYSVEESSWNYMNKIPLFFLARCNPNITNNNGDNPQGSAVKEKSVTPDLA